MPLSCRWYLFDFVTLFNIKYDTSDIDASSPFFYFFCIHFWLLCIYCVIWGWEISLQIARVIWIMPWIFSWDIYFICISQFISSKRSHETTKKKCDSFSYFFLFHWMVNTSIDIFIFKESFNILVEKQLIYIFFCLFIVVQEHFNKGVGGVVKGRLWINIPNIV